MVAVAQHHVAHIAVNPFLKEIGRSIVARCAVVPSRDPLTLWKFPLVGTFVHHEHSLLIADVIEHRSLNIMAHSDGIGSHQFQRTHPSAPHFFRDSRSEHSCIMVQTHTLHLHILPVELKSRVGIKLQGSQPHRADRLVHRLPILHDLAFECIEIRTVD